MKKFIPLLLALLLILSGCSAEKAGKVSVSSQTGTVASSSAGTTSEQKQSTDKTVGEKNSASEKSGGKRSNTSSKSAKDKNENTSKAYEAKTGSSEKIKKKPGVKSTAKPKTTVKHTESSEINCTITVDWTAGMMYDDGTKSYLAKNVSLKLKSGATAYDALKNLCSARGVALDAVDSQFGVYVKSIGGLAEKDRGKYSGWKYTVNGSYPSKSCGKYKLNNGDNIVFIYSVS